MESSARSQLNNRMATNRSEYYNSLLAEQYRMDTMPRPVQTLGYDASTGRALVRQLGGDPVYAQSITNGSIPVGRSVASTVSGQTLRIDDRPRVVREEAIVEETVIPSGVGFVIEYGNGGGFIEWKYFYRYGNSQFQQFFELSLGGNIPGVITREPPRLETFVYIDEQTAMMEIVQEIFYLTEGVPSGQEFHQNIFIFRESVLNRQVRYVRNVFPSVPDEPLEYPGLEARYAAHLRTRPVPLGGGVGVPEILEFISPLGTFDANKYPLSKTIAINTYRGNLAIASSDALTPISWYINQSTFNVSRRTYTEPFVFGEVPITRITTTSASVTNLGLSLDDQVTAVGFSGTLGEFLSSGSIENFFLLYRSGLYDGSFTGYGAKAFGV